MTKLALGRLAQRFEVTRFGDVRGNRSDPAASLTDRRFRRAKRLAWQVGKHNRHAKLCETLCGGQPNAARAARDDGGSAILQGGKVGYGFAHVRT